MQAQPDDTPDYGDPSLNEIAGVSPVGNDFAGRIAQLRADLQARGVPTQVISGYRSPSQQAWLVAHPQGNPVAAPGNSFHNYGAAVDLVPGPGVDYAKGNAIIGQLASDPDRGLAWGGNWSGSQRDPNHIQLGGVTLDQLRGGTPGGASAYNAPAGTLGAYRQGVEKGQSAVTDKVPDLLGSWGAAPATANASGSPSGVAKDSAGAPIVPGQDIIVQHKSASGVPDLLGAWKTEPEPAGPINGQPADVSHPQLLAASTGVLNGVPIVGPYLQSGVEHASAAMHTLANGMPYADNLAVIQERTRAAQAANPLSTTAGNVVGGIAGTVPAMAALPAAFGVGGSGLLANSLASGVTGAAIGGADSAVRSGGDLNAMKQGAEVGGALGLVAPGAGKLIGAGVNALSNRVSRTTPAAKNIFGVLQEAGLSPTEASNALARMGPHATLADINPALTTEAGGLASMGGAPTSILKSAMAARAGQADNRVAQAIDQSLGPKPDLTATKDAIYQQAQRSADPYYSAARANASPMDITPVLNNIDAQLKNAVGGEAAVLNKAKAYLTDQKVGLPGPNGQPTTLIVPKDDPGALLKVRQALDGDIESLQRNGTIDGTSAGKSAFRAANDIRGQLDGVLKTDPNIALGDANFAHHMALKDAVDNGTELFTKGVRPEDFQRSLAAMSPEQLAATRQGARVAIGDALENARRGTLSGAQSMFSRSSANRAKLDMLFPNSGDVFDMLHGEASMRATEQLVAHNSATAERQAVQQKYKPSSEPGIGAAVPILGEAVGGGPGAAAAIGGRILYTHARDALTRNALNRLTEGTARGLAATGPEQQEFMAQVGRAGRTGATTNALSSGSSALTNLLTRTIGQHLGQNALASP